MATTPPTDTVAQAEQALLGALVMSPESYWQITDLEPADFSTKKHQDYFRTIRGMVHADEHVDVITVAEKFNGRGQGVLSEIGAYAKDSILPMRVPTYAEIVKGAARKRHARDVLRQGLQGLDGGADVSDVIGDVLTRLEMPASAHDKPFSMVLSEALSAAEQARDREKDGVIGIDTTIPTLNQFTKGLHGGRLITLGGRPGSFKSALAWQIAIRGASQGYAVGVISLEMMAAELGTRAISNQIKVDGQLFAAGDAHVIDVVRKKLEGNQLAGLPLWVDDKSQKFADIVSRIVEWRAKHQIQLAVIDYLQLIRITGRSKREEIGEITRQLKLLAMKLEFPILLVSQLNRDPEREKRRPQLSDLRESGDVEQDSDIVIFTHVQRAATEHDQDHYEMILAKQRGGPARKIINLRINGMTFFVGEAASHG